MVVRGVGAVLEKVLLGIVFAQAGVGPLLLRRLLTVGAAILETLPGVVLR